MKILNVKCEYLKNPCAIDILNPRITWTLEGIDNQKAFKIHYSVNENKKESELIESSSMNYIFKDSFKSRDIVKYQIEVISDKDEHIFSEENSFEFGLLNSNDWEAKWITGNYKVNKKRRYPADYFKKTFNVKDLKKARLYITACGVYEASINGKKVGDIVLAPGFTSAHHRLQYQSYDCTSLLKEGENTLEVVLGDGYFRGTTGAWGHRNVYGIETKLFAQLELSDSSDKVTKVVTDETWSWSNDGPIKINDFKDGERVDANLTPTYKGKAKLTKFKTTLRCSNNEPVKEIETFKPIKEIITPSGKHVLEFPTMICGYFSFKINAKKGDFIRLVLGEMLDEKGEFTLKNIQCANKHTITPLQEIDYVAKEGINEYKPKFFYGGFRYVLVESDAPYSIDDFTAYRVHNAFDKVSSFETSNPLINVFYQNTYNSLVSNSVECPTDCPTRERAGWTGDAQVFFNTATYLVDYRSFARKYLEDMKDEQFKNGAFRQICPSVGEDWYMRTLNGSVGWADAGIFIPYRFYLEYGDKRILENAYNSMEKYIHFMIKRIGKWAGPISKRIPFSRKNRKYLVTRGQSYGEWLEPEEIFPQHWTAVIFPHPEVSTAYTNYTLRMYQDILNVLGKDSEAKSLTRFIDGTKIAYQELVTKKGYTLDTKRQACLVRPLYMNLLNENQKVYAKEKLIEDLNSFDWRIGTGFLSTPFILDVLKDIDVEYAYKLLENEKMPGWLFMAKNSTHSIWESWEGPYTKANIAVASLNHYSKGALVEFLFRSVVGINVSGENTFNLTPVIGGHLTYAKAHYDSVYGKVEMMWKRENDKVTFSFTVPANTKANFIYKDYKKVYLPGKYEFTLNI